MPLIDTDIVIDALRGRAQAVERLNREEQDNTAMLSTVSYLEVLVGCGDKRAQQTTERFLQRFTLLVVDAAICERTVALVRRYNLSHGLQMADAFIAATALIHGLTLLTKNTRDFRFIAGLTLEPYSDTPAF